MTPSISATSSTRMSFFPATWAGLVVARQAIVGFALIVPVMFLLLLVAVDFGRLFASYVQVRTLLARRPPMAPSHRPIRLS